MEAGRIFTVVVFLFVFVSCGENIQNHEVERVLPILGEKEITYLEVDGEKVIDTLFHTIPPFSFLNHDSVIVTNEDVDGRVYVANFFFTHCPSICPAMTKQMKRLNENTKDIEELIFLSHTIDPKRDTLGRLREYREIYEINTDNWHFLYGSMEYTYDIGKYGYLVNAMEDEEADGGYLHSEHLVLIDREGRIRGLYEGTYPEKVDQLERDIRKLIEKEYGKK